MRNAKYIGEMIQRMRKEKGLTQEELGVELCVTKQAVSNWENGKNEPDKDILQKLEEEYDLDFRDSEIIKETKMQTKIEKLQKIETFEEVQVAVNDIINQMKVDSATDRTIKKLLQLTLVNMIAFSFCLKEESEWLEVTWGSVAYIIDELLDRDEVCPMDPAEFHGWFGSVDDFTERIVFITSEKLRHINWNAYNENYIQKLGFYAITCGFKLASILPDNENSIMTAYKTALLELVDVLYEIDEE